MSLRFVTPTPRKLLSAFKTAIDEGKIVTWAYDKEGDFTHTAEQWKYSAWLRPKIEDGKTLIFFLVKPENKVISSVTYSIYHGRFIESMLVHCDSLFTNASATAFPADGDTVE